MRRIYFVVATVYIQIDIEDIEFVYIESWI